MNPTLDFSIDECRRILNVGPNATLEAVRKSYRALVREHHPDLNPGGQGSRIRDITRAYRLLKTHHQAARPEAPPAGGEAQSSPVLNMLVYARARARRLGKDLFGLDVEKELVVDAATALAGGKVRVRRGTASFSVTLPAGAWQRMQLKVPGQGDLGLFGNRRGDLLLNIRVREDAREPAQGEAVFYYEIPVARDRVAGGRVLTLDSKDGPIKFFLPRSVRDGETFILKSRPGGGARHIVTIRLV